MQVKPLQLPAFRRSLVFLAMAFLAAGSASLWAYTVDDAWITFRYARNAAHGLGVVYNQGQHVEGFTSPSWLLLSTIAELSRLSPEHVSKAASLILVAAFIAFTWKCVGKESIAGTLPLLILAMHSPLLVGIVCGLEAAAAAAMIGCLLILATRDEIPWRPLAAIGCAALCTRPECALLLAALGACLLLTRRTSRREVLLVGGKWVTTIVVLTIARKFYFGQWVPNTAVAKIRPDSGALPLAWRYIASWAVRYWWLIALSLPALLDRRCRRLSFTSAALIVAQLVFVFVSGGDWMPQWRFMLPVSIVLIVLACAGMRSISGASPLHRTAWITTTAICLASQVWSLRTDRWQIDSEQRTLAWLEDGPVQYMRSRATPNTCIAARDIGMLGYQANAAILDLVGLTDSRIARASGFRKRENIDRDYVFGRRPEFLILQSEKPDENPPTLDRLARELVKDPRFNSYRLAKRFDIPGRHFCEVYERLDEATAIAEPSEPRP